MIPKFATVSKHLPTSISFRGVFIFSLLAAWKLMTSLQKYHLQSLSIEINFSSQASTLK